MKRARALRIRNVPLLATAVVLVLLAGGASIAYDGFFSGYQFRALLAGNASLGLAAIGMTFVILSGGIDLSVGALIALSSMIVAAAIVQWSIPALIATPAALAFGAAFGAGQGVIVQFFRLPPFLVTLAGMFLARGAALALTSEKRISITADPVYDALAAWSFVGLGPPALAFLVAVFVGACVSHWTRFGRTVYAIGGDERSAMLMGLPVGRVKVGVYAISGLCAAAGGVVHAFGSGAGDASIAYMLELDAIAAVVIGGTLLTGGVGSVGGTLLGVLILGVITTIPTYQGNLNSWWTRIAIGALLLGFILLQKGVQRATARRS